MERKMTEEMIDDCIAEVLAKGDVATADEPGPRELKRDLRETTARLSAASPYMKPPEDLRGRILQATAPQSFRMEDYRKVMRDNSRFFKWGFYAAMLFLMAAGWFNMTATNANEQMRTSLATAQQQLNTLQGSNQQLLAALATFSPDVKILQFRDAKQQPFAQALIDESTKRALLILPPEMIAGNTGELVMEVGGNRIAFQTSVMADPHKVLVGAAPQGLASRKTLNVQEVTPDANNPNVRNARFGPQ
jgi:hypothetical protein